MWLISRYQIHRPFTPIPNLGDDRFHAALAALNKYRVDGIRVDVGERIGDKLESEYREITLCECVVGLIFCSVVVIYAFMTLIRP